MKNFNKLEKEKKPKVSTKKELAKIKEEIIKQRSAKQQKLLIKLKAIF